MKFSVFHALSCKKAGFVSLRHNELVDIIGKLCEEVCRDVRKQPMLMELNGVKLHQTTAKRRPEARLDGVPKVSGWRVFMDVSAFELNAQRHGSFDIQKCFRRNKEEKKPAYNQRVLKAENATFTLLVLATNGGKGRECKTL